MKNSIREGKNIGGLNSFSNPIVIDPPPQSFRLGDYYVSPTGNDSNDGTTLATAFLTLNKAAQTATAGETVSVLYGTYSNLTTVNSGTEGNRIVFQAYDLNNKPTIDASGGSNAIRCEDTYITIDGFKTTDSTTGIQVVNDECIIQNCEVLDSASWGMSVYIVGGDNIIIRRNYLASTGKNFHCEYANTLDFYYNILVGGNNIQAYFQREGTYNVYNNTIVKGDAFGLYIGNASSTVTVKNNLIYGYGTVVSTGVGLYCASTNVTYSYNLIGENVQNANKTITGGTDGGDNLVGSDYDPAFTDYDNGDYTLTGSSDAIDAGVNVSLSEDYASNSVGTPPNIGAYE